MNPEPGPSQQMLRSAGLFNFYWDQMYGIKSHEGRSSVSLCGCRQDRAHSRYGNIVLHISRDDLRDLGIAIQSVADGGETSEQANYPEVTKGLVQQS